jgi:hypothetical protein
LTFIATPSISGTCKFGIIVRNGQGTGTFSNAIETSTFDVEYDEFIEVQTFANSGSQSNFSTAFLNAVYKNIPSGTKFNRKAIAAVTTNIQSWQTSFSSATNANIDVSTTPLAMNIAWPFWLNGAGMGSGDLLRLWWDFQNGNQVIVQSFMVYTGIPCMTEYTKFEVVGSNDGLNFVRIPTLWNVGGIDTVEDTFHLKYDRKSKGGVYSWVTAHDRLPLMLAPPQGHLSTSSGQFTGVWHMTQQNTPAVICSIKLQNDTKYRYYGIGSVGNETPYNSVNRTDQFTGARTYARCASTSYEYWFAGMNLPSTIPQFGAVILDSEHVNQKFNGLGGMTNFMLPQIVTGAGSTVTVYKYWRIRATSAFLGTCGSATKAYFWKLGLYRDTTTATADTYGLSSNNYLQQYANVVAVSTAGNTPTAVGTTQRDALCVSKGDWTQTYSTTSAGVTGLNALQNNATSVAFQAELACIHFTLDVAGVIGAIRFPDNMYYDANVRGGTFIIEAATASAPTTWVTMVATSTTSAGKYLGREGILNAVPSTGIIAAGNQALNANFKVFTVAAATGYTWPTLGTLTASGLVVGTSTSCTIVISGGTSANTERDFNVHLVASGTSSPYWTPGTTIFNCTVTGYSQVSSNWTLAFDCTPWISGTGCFFAVYVRSGEGTGALGTSVSPTAGILASTPITIAANPNIFYVYPSTDILTFNGSSDFINIGNLGTVGTAYTIELWLKYAITQGYQNPCDMNYSTYSGLGNAGPRFEFGYWLWGGSSVSDSVYANTTQSVMSTNVWYCVAMTMNSGTVNSYCNGSIVSTNMASSASGYFTTFGSVNLGRGYQPQGTARYFNGSIANFKIYNRVLNSTEIAQSFTSNRSRFGI